MSFNPKLLDEEFWDAQPFIKCPGFRPNGRRCDHSLMRCPDLGEIKCPKCKTLVRVVDGRAYAIARKKRKAA